MKEATGELSMTVITIVAVVAVLGILTVFLLPKISEFVGTQWGQMQGKVCTTDAKTGKVTCK